MTNTSSVPVPSDLMAAFLAGFGEEILDPLTALQRSNAKDDAPAHNMGRLLGIREAFNWLNRAYEQHHGRPYHVFRNRQAAGSTQAAAAPGPAGGNG